MAHSTDSSPAAPSPASLSSLSPLTATDPRTSTSPYSPRSDAPDIDQTKEPASGPRRAHRADSRASARAARAKSPSAAAPDADSDKPKRCRVTAHQLAHLERFFGEDRSPTAARRREISELLSMTERQTQIWFQNRRAKAKAQDGKAKARGLIDLAPPEDPPELSAGFQADLHSLLHEDEAITVIPCSALSIGTWRRIASATAKHDLVAYMCDAKRVLAWFVHSGGCGFKIEVPYEAVSDTRFTNSAPGAGIASFVLSRPPTFYMEHTRPTAQGPMRQWRRCADWTEARQASTVLQHDIAGSAVQLAHILRDFRAAAAPGSDIQLYAPSYPPAAPAPAPGALDAFGARPLDSPAPEDDPAPPLSAASDQGFGLARASPALSMGQLAQFARARSFSVPHAHAYGARPPYAFGGGLAHAPMPPRMPYAGMTSLGDAPGAPMHPQAHALGDPAHAHHQQQQQQYQAHPPPPPLPQTQAQTQSQNQSQTHHSLSGALAEPFPGSLFAYERAAPSTPLLPAAAAPSPYHSRTGGTLALGAFHAPAHPFASVIDEYQLHAGAGAVAP